MTAILELFSGTGTASTLVFLSLVGALGIFIGKLKIGGLKLGIAGVLFVGILIGHWGVAIDAEVLHFVKEFGLILFVYSIGIEIGPRFLASLKNNGLKLNIFAASIVLLGLACTVLVKYLFHLDIEIVAGLFTGAVTNTPSLGAVQSLLIDQNANGNHLAEVAGMAYAVAYPFGVLGIILAMAMVRIFFRIKIGEEEKRFKKELTMASGNIKTIKVQVTNPNLIGQSLASLSASIKEDFVVSRVFRNGEYIVPEGKMILQENDMLVGLSQKQSIPNIELIVGRVGLQDTLVISGDLSMRHIMLTNRRLTGKSLKSINLTAMYPANITRVFRGESEIIPTGDTVLQFGDTIRIVGKRDRMDEVAKFLGNSLRDLSSPNLIPLFIGVFLGIVLGSIPIFIPGLPAPAKLGLAGGPLIIALLLGHKGRIGSFDFYMTPGANHFIREMGIVLFLGCVGISSGKHFISTITNGGYMWILYGAFITFVPLLIMGIVGRLMKLNYLEICGYLAGSMTDPPALEFANRISPVQAQATAYATVYPLTMFLRILVAQILVLFFI